MAPVSALLAAAVRAGGLPIGLVAPMLGCVVHEVLAASPAGIVAAPWSVVGVRVRTLKHKVLRRAIQVTPVVLVASSDLSCWLLGFDGWWFHE